LAWIAHSGGPSEFIPAFEGFRPFLGPIFFLTTSLLPADPLVWQGVALLVRFCAALVVRFTLGQIWPHERRFGTAVALLFLVFPGYSQHWVAFTHVNQEWISLVAYLLSFGLGVHSIRRPRTAVAATATALILQAVGLLPTEYFIGLELLRPVFHWSVYAESIDEHGRRLRSTLRTWLPYLVLWLANAAWLGYYYRSGAYISYGLNPAARVPAPYEVLQVLGDALWKAAFYVWFQVLPLASESLASPSSMATIAVIAVGFLLLLLYLLRLDQSSTPSASTGGRTMAEADKRGTQARFAHFVILIGIAGIILGRAPSFAAGLPLTLQSSFDRLTISMMLGASLFAAGLLQFLIASPRIRTYALAALLALGIGQQFFNANIFRRDWQRQQEIYWQLAWRMPALEPHTAILTQQMPLDYETDLGMTAALNWMYATDLSIPELPYAVIYTEKRLGGDALPALRPGIPLRLPLRTVEFIGSTSQAIVVHVPPNGCLRVFDPAYDDAETYSRFPESQTAAIPLSDPSRIIAQGGSPSMPSPPFVPEPAHGWCYFYEKAELARQIRDWPSIVTLRAQAADNWQDSGDPFEWLPFIEAEARAGDSTWAAQQAREAIVNDERLERGMCALWKRVGLSSPDELRDISAGMLAEMHCDG
jgi:hypothetical protein